MIQVFRPALPKLTSAKLIAFFQPALSLSFLWWGVSAAAAQAAVELRVAVEQQANTVVVGSSTPATVSDGNGNSIGQIPNGRAVTVQSQGANLRLADWQGQAFWVEPNDDGFVL